MDRYDSIIIGGGLGGLVAGAKLAKEGKKVLLMEAGEGVGGCARTFTRGNRSIESLHAIDGLDQEDFKLKILDELGVMKEVEFVSIPEFYRFIGPTTDLVVPFSFEGAAGAFKSAFPKDAKGIDAFFSRLKGVRRDIKKLSQGMGGWKETLLMPFYSFIYPDLTAGVRLTVGGFLDKITKNEELKLALAANVQYYGDDPYALSLLYFSLAQSSFYAGGGHFIKGGSQRLSECLARIIKDGGGAVLTGHKATGILVQNGAASGVRYEDRDKSTFEASGSTVIANASVPAVVNELLPAGAAPAGFARTIKSLRPSCSLLTVHVAFKKPPAGFGSRAYSTLVYDGIKKLSEVGTFKHAVFDKAPFAFVDYGRIDSGLSSGGAFPGALTAVDYIANWEGLADDEYRTKKEEAARALIKRLDAVAPGLAGAVDSYEVSTARTILEYTGNPDGAVYGFAQTPEQTGMKRVQIKAPVGRLYFASAWSFPGGGFSGAITGGYFAALDALKEIG